MHLIPTFISIHKITVQRFVKSLYRMAAVIIVCLAVLQGCSQEEPTPTTAPPAETAETEPTNTAEPAPTPTSEPALVEAESVLIKSDSTALYLYEAEGVLEMGELEADNEAYQWLIEDYQGSKRIQNKQSANYLSIEQLLDHIQVIPIEPHWMSPRWTFELNEETDTLVIRNIWHNWEVMYVAPDGEGVDYGRYTGAPGGDLWVVESLTGEAVAAAPTAVPAALPTPGQPEGQRGAAVPWIEYEAEEGETNGDLLGPDRKFGTFATESSGRQSVQLNETGDYVEFETTAEANSIVVRYVIPDADEGDGIEATISLYVDGEFSQKLNLTSRYAWSYGGEQYAFNAPAAGGAHHFFDEARALTADIPAGATVRLQKDADDTADYYVIDLVDLEQVGPPLEMPDGYLSITDDCGAVADDNEDDGPAIQDCINQARTAESGVWIPAGTFESTTEPFSVQDVTIRGAGMWYSTIHGYYARFNCMGNGCRYYDFAILGETIDRDDESPENGFNNGAGTGSHLENIWVEHTKVGYWVGPGSTNGLVIINSRFRNLFADGINFTNGTSNSVVENSHFRNTGDDALAAWSFAGTVNTNNIFRFNTVQLPWRANCIAIYGGIDNKVEDNICADVITYPGIFIAQEFNAHPFGGITSVQRNSLIRAGGSFYNQEHGALKIRAGQGDIDGLIMRDILIEGSTFAGIELEGSYAITNAEFENIEIINSGRAGIHIRSNVAGAVSFSGVSIENSGADALINFGPPLHFELILGPGNVGW